MTREKRRGRTSLSKGPFEEQSRTLLVFQHLLV